MTVERYISAMTILHDLPRVTKHEFLKRLGEPRAGGLLLVNLDDISVVNCWLGHGVTDTSIAQLYRRMEAACAGRLVALGHSNDEFVVLLDDVPAAERVGETLRTWAEDHFASIRADAIAAEGSHRSAQRNPLTLTGVIADVGSYPTVAAALQQAQEGMYAAKQEGGNRIGRAPPWI